MQKQTKYIVAHASEEEHRRVKLAAAMQGISINRFVRNIVLQAAKQATATIDIAAVLGEGNPREQTI